MIDHDDHEELAALSAGGLLSEREYMEFLEHVRNCVTCREAYEQYGELLYSGLPRTEGLLHQYLGRMKVKTDDGIRSRFLARARREGIVFTSEIRESAPPRQTLFPGLLAAGAVAALLVLAFYGLQIYRNSKLSGSGQSAQQLQQLQKQNSTLSSNISELNESLAARQQEIQKLRAQLDAAKSAAPHDSDAPATNSRNVQLQDDLANSEKQLADARSEVQRINQMRAGDAASLAAQQARIRELSNQIRIANATLEMERQLSVAGRDIRELLTARQLHVIDVRDTDVNGKASAAFGRVFVTEGKSLTFYAFDLNQERAIDAKYRFEVWGSQQGSKNPAQKLGILNEDDKTDRRWALNVSKPDVIRGIDSVFVTVEPSADVQAPDGQRMLYAYLGQPNHP